jgi:hypothetical protein
MAVSAKKSFDVPALRRLVFVLELSIAHSAMHNLFFAKKGHT